MILSLQFDREYTSGENERADAMRARWKKFYPDFSPYESELNQLDPRRFFKLYNAALRSMRDTLKRCVSLPEKAVKQALRIGRQARPTPRKVIRPRTLFRWSVLGRLITLTCRRGRLT
jgi:hypothetical protein